jgi:uncharacterized small protein (DUF1192 family)
VFEAKRNKLRLEIGALEAEIERVQAKLAKKKEELAAV